MSSFNTSALVLFSGGQDSATCLAWALDRYEKVETIGFSYGQRHSIELTCRESFLDKLKINFPVWSTKLGQDHLLDLSLLGQISDTALTQEKAIQMEESGLPNTFVPGRNLLFLTFAAAVAYRRNLKIIVGGMCETDYSGYPDCRDDTIKALQVAISLGLDTRLVLETPLMWIDKADTWNLAKNLEVMIWWNSSKRILILAIWETVQKDSTGGTVVTPALHVNSDALDMKISYWIKNDL